MSEPANRGDAMRIGHEFMDESATAATVAIDISNLNLLFGRKMIKDRDFRTTFIVLIQNILGIYLQDTD